jgi:MSHA biogenesis protein MshQ
MLRLITLIALITTSSFVSAQTQCVDVFSNVLATFNSNNGDVRFRQNSRVINSDGTIDFQQNRIAHDNNANNTCGNQLCSASGNFAEALDLPPFMFSNSNIDVTIAQNSNNSTIQEGQFDTVTVAQNQTLSFISQNGLYIIDELILQQGAVVNFAPGDYWVDDLRMAQNSRIETDGSGIVRLFVTDVDDRNSNVRFVSQNAQINPNQSSRNFLIVSYDDFRFTQNVNINAHLYSVDDVIIGNNSLFTGSIVLGDALEIQPNSQVTFDNQNPRELSFGDLCGSNVLIANYEFEELNPTVDSANGNNGAFVGDALDVRLAGATSNQTCSVLDVPLNQSIGNNDGFETPINVGQQLGNAGTISFWYRSDVQWNQGFFGLDRKLFDASLPFGNQNDNEDKFFFLVLQNNGSLLFGLEDEDDNNGLLVSSRFNFAADEWVHIAATWDVGSQQMALFINGAPAAASFVENALDGNFSQTNTLRLGDNRSSYLPNVGTSPNSGDGQFDSLRLYNFAQSAPEVDADRIASDVSNCGAPLEAIALYQFQPSEVPNDSLGFSDGALVGNASGVVLPVPTNVCGVLDIPLNQSATPSDAFNTRVDIGETMGNRGTISFWYRSDEDWNLGGSGLDRKLFDASIPFGNGDDDEDKFFFLNLQNNGRLLFGLEDPNDNNTRIETNALNFSANEWVHIAATWDVITQQATLFINGSQEAATFLERSAFGSLSETNTLFIGDNRSTYLPAVGTTANSSNGQFDEVRLYRFDQTSSQILADINAQPPGCFDDILINHYRLNYGSSFTCAASEVNVQACANESCNVLATSNASLTLTTTDNGTFSATNLTFVGSTTSELSSSSPGIVTIGASDLNPNADVRCFNNNIEDNSCAVTFSEVGLTVSFGDDQNIIDIPDTIAQLPFDNEIIVRVDQSGACDAELEGRSLDIAVQCNDPGSCNANQLRINGAVIGDIEDFNATGVNFDANGQATIPANFLQYRDAGQIELLFRDGQDEATGSSNRFVMRPVLIANAGTSTQLVAGVPSLLFYEAVGAEGSLTPNYNPSNLQIQLAKVIPEPGFGNQGVMNFFEDTTTLFNTADPDDAVFVDIDENGFDFMGNVPGRSLNVQPEYSEVGTVTLQIRDENYLDSGPINSALITSLGLEIGPITLGRYIPSYFSVESNAPSLTDTCNVFSYIGQNIEFTSDLTFTVTAHNAGGGITSNYGGNNLTASNGSSSPNDLWQLEITSGNVTFDDTTDNGGTVFRSFSVNDTDINFDGMATYTISAPNEPEFNGLELVAPVARHTKDSTPQAPFLASFNALLSNDVDDNGTPTDESDDIFIIIDEDNVCFREDALSDCAQLDPVMIEGASMRYGRLAFDSAFGPETEDILIPFRTEFFNEDGNFVVNDDDNCTELVLSNNDFGRDPPDVDIPNLVDDIGDISSNGRLLNGRSLPISTDGIRIPAANDIGGFILSIQPQDPSIGIGGQQFLNFDWDNDGDIDQDDYPFALVSFGIFRGNDRIIHWREVFGQ